MLTFKPPKFLWKRWKPSKSTELIPLSVLAMLLAFSVGWRFLKSSELQNHAYAYPFSLSSENSGQETLERSISFYQGRVQRNPEDGLDQAALASAYLKMVRATGNDSWYLLAEQSAQQSLTKLPFDNDGAVLVLARIAEAKHDFAEANRLAEQASGPEALAIIVTSKLAIGQVEAADAAANTLVDLNPSLGSLTLRALTRSARGDQDGALRDFQQAIAAEELSEPRGSAWTRTLLGRVYFQQGNSALASQLYREALQIVPDYPLAQLYLAELETRLGHYRTAQQYYLQVNDPVALHGIARIQALQGKAADAPWETAETALRQHIDENALGHRRDLAHLLLERGNTEDVPEAIALMQAEANNRRDAKTLDLLAWSLSRAGRWQEAQQIIQEALASGIQDAGIFYRAGVIETALNRASQANRYFRLAQEIDPTFDQQAHQRLGLVAHR
ncbi:MAG: tetratricopeptide repeat protein [Cyanobacteria bacterium J06642_9]